MKYSKSRIYFSIKHSQIVINQLIMKTQDFINLLQANPVKELVFEYRSGQTVGANYHITEVKNITVDSVDCGGGTNYWKETVIQLLEDPSEKGKTRSMTAAKALGILNRVNSIKPMDPMSPVKFEYGNQTFHTTQLPVGDYITQGDQLLLRLREESALCKGRKSNMLNSPGGAGINKSVVPVGGCC